MLNHGKPWNCTFFMCKGGNEMLLACNKPLSCFAWICGIVTCTNSCFVTGYQTRIRSYFVNKLWFRINCLILIWYPGLWANSFTYSNKAALHTDRNISSLPFTHKGESNGKRERTTPRFIAAQVMKTQWQSVVGHYIWTKPKCLQKGGQLAGFVAINLFPLFLR